ncbi:MAG: hypothetical protein GQ559_07590 [Desulfobulbaceae bacterium]|nr:hypothetical protein [Desulfobulbaceae bacterium]
MSAKQNFFCMIFGLVCFGALACSCVAGGDSSNHIKALPSNANKGISMRVLWTVAAYYVGQNSTWGEAEARRMLFKPLDVTSSTITFDSQTCHDVKFADEVVDVTQYLRERYQTTAQALSIEEETMKVIRTNCLLPGFNEYMRLPDRRLIVSIQGVLFVFDPAVNY